MTDMSTVNRALLSVLMRYTKSKLDLLDLRSKITANFDDNQSVNKIISEASFSWLFLLNELNELSYRTLQEILNS